jgi:hypothetical protein
VNDLRKNLGKRNEHVECLRRIVAIESRGQSKLFFPAIFVIGNRQHGFWVLYTERLDVFAMQL